MVRARRTLFKAVVANIRRFAGWQDRESRGINLPFLLSWPSSLFCRLAGWRIADFSDGGWANPLGIDLPSRLS